MADKPLAYQPEMGVLNPRLHEYTNVLPAGFVRCQRTEKQTKMHSSCLGGQTSDIASRLRCERKILALLAIVTVSIEIIRMRSRNNRETLTKALTTEILSYQDLWF